MESGDDWNRQDDFLNELIPENPGKPYDMKTVIEALADNGLFMEYQEYFAPNLITGFIHMGGRSTGVIANQPKAMAGCLDINASDKAGGCAGISAWDDAGAQRNYPPRRQAAVCLQ